MTVETLELIKANFELIKGEPEVNNVFPLVGNGKELLATDGPTILADAKKIGVTPSDFKVKILDPKQIALSAWNYKQRQDKIQEMVDDPERLKKCAPILIHEKKDGSYEVIDGGHRRTAAIRLELPIKTLCVNDKAYQALDNVGWRDTKMYRLANYLFGKGLI
jgi:hypothetical protein